jgi:uncharacterized protein (UPF0332 family)
MPVTPHDLKDFAEGDVGSLEETRRRASVSRAYYAVFHAVLPFASQLPRSAKCRLDSRYVTHQELYDRVVEWRTGALHPALKRMTQTRKQMAAAIHATRMLREKADYRLDDTLKYGEARAQLQRAKNILRLMAQIDRELKRGDAA